MSIPVQYVCQCQSNEGQIIRFSLEEQGWLQKYKKELDNAAVIEFIPNDDNLPPIVLPLGNGRRFIYVSRVFGSPAVGAILRLYGFGWQATVDGRNIKNIIWVYPNGSVEVAEEPVMIGQVLAQLPQHLANRNGNPMPE